MASTEPKYIVDCEAPETWNGKTCHPTISYFYNYESALKFIRSKVSLGPNVPLKHKHIWGIREYGSVYGDWCFRTAG